MLLPVIAVAAVHLFTAVLAELTSDPYPICYRKWDSPAMSCFRKDLVSIKNTQTLIDGGLPMYGSQEKRRNITLPAGHCTQLSCIEGDAILYCHHVSMAAILSHSMAANLFRVYKSSPVIPILRS